MHLNCLYRNGLLALVSIGFAGSVAAEKPLNVIFILADDLGWADTSLYGKTSFYQTPNLDRLAQRGMVFTRAYSASPLCSPTRASILTGQTPARNGFTTAGGHHDEVRLKAKIRSVSIEHKATQTESVTRLDTSYPTLGKLIQKNGYATAHFGKWHVGEEPYSPLQHGFDVDVPHWPGSGPAGSYIAPWQFPKFRENFSGEHIEDRMAEEAVQWMQSLPENQPFYMNYWMFSVHTPFDAKKTLIEYYRGRMDPENPQRSPTYAAMVHSMDDAVGTLLDAVDRTGIADRTVIIFASDNGGNMYGSLDGTVPTSNFPLRGGKATLFEGGIRVPCVVVWPGVTKPGSRSDEMIQSTDFYPTILHALKTNSPDGYPVDGVDIMPALQGYSLGRRPIFTYFPHVTPVVPDWLPPAIAVHEGDWKLIRLFFQGENGAHSYQLYNLKEDLGETNNLFEAYPEKVAELDRMIEDYLTDTQAVTPERNPDFDPAHYHPERIGVPVKRRPKTPKGSSIDGWTAGGSCSVLADDGIMVVSSTGNDPQCVLASMSPVKGAGLKFRLRMKSFASPDATVYYNIPFSSENSVPLSVSADGQWHEYEISVPAESLNGLRIDPANKPGTVHIDWMQLQDSEGQCIQRWDFEQAK